MGCVAALRAADPLPRLLRMLAALLAAALVATTGAGDAARGVSVDWPSFLARSDPVWTSPPTDWYEAGFVGNGKLGTLVSSSDFFRGYFRGYFRQIRKSRRVRQQPSCSPPHPN